MYYLCICEQPDNSDLFKGYGPTSISWGGEAYELSYNVNGRSRPSEG